MMSCKMNNTALMQEALAFCIAETEKNILEFYEEAKNQPDDAPVTRAEIARDMQKEFHYLYILKSMYSIV